MNETQPTGVLRFPDDDSPLTRAMAFDKLVIDGAAVWIKRSNTLSRLKLVPGTKYEVEIL